MLSIVRHIAVISPTYRVNLRGGNWLWPFSKYAACSHIYPTALLLYRVVSTLSLYALLAPYYGIATKSLTATALIFIYQVCIRSYSRPQPSFKRHQAGDQTGWLLFTHLLVFNQRRLFGVAGGEKWRKTGGRRPSAFPRLSLGLVNSHRHDSFKFTRHFKSSTSQVHSMAIKVDANNNKTWGCPLHTHGTCGFPWKLMRGNDW